MRFVITALVLVACGGASATTTVTDADPVLDDAASTTAVVVVTDTTAPAVTADDATVIFVAAVEATLVGTAYEGAALESPEVFVATGRLLCERLDAGDTVREVLSDYLDELAGGADRAGDDQLVLAGAVLGAAAVTLCPHHASEVG